MNTDMILDFIVENYIWFIVGGLILVMALIGFIADKKKYFSKKIKNLNESKNKIDQDVNNVDVESSSEEKVSEGLFVDNFVETSEINEPEGINEQENTLTKNELSQPIDDLSFNENYELDDHVGEQQNAFDLSNHDQTVDNISTVDSTNSVDNINNIDSISPDYIKEPNLYNYYMPQQKEQSFSNENVIENNDNYDNYHNVPIDLVDNKEKTEQVSNNEFINYGNDIQAETNINDQDENISSASDFTERLSQPVKVNSNSSDEFNHEQVPSSIDYDINLINNMNFSSANIVPNEENNNSTGSIIDNTDQPLQVNYAQLKQMVEDIISETNNENIDEEKESNEQRIKNTEVMPDTSLSESNGNEIKDIPLQNLDYTTVDTINQLDDDEDDVWKF